MDKSQSTAITNVFANEITEQGLAELRKTYPSDVVHDMSDMVQFKAARLIRTERNKLLESIKRRRLDVKGEVETVANKLSEEVTDIYSTIVIPFEIELERQRVAKEKAEKQKRTLLTKQRIQIKEINNWVNECIGKSSQEISNIIEAVDLIDTACFHKDIIHEAIAVKKDTLKALADLLAQEIANEMIQQEREQHEFENRLNALRMIPIDYFDKPANEISERISELSQHSISRDEYGAKYVDAIGAQKEVLKKLNVMLNQAQQLASTALHSTEQVQIDEPVEQQTTITSITDELA
ncbi:MAG: hypothetical protein HRU25_08050, partial [Psychrobium sp.]|nr:hypothetical protein [Psychrobium sp.]